MYNKKYSLGRFLNLVDPSRKRIERDIQHSLSSNFEHIEIWLEVEGLSKSTISFICNKFKGYNIIVHAAFINLSLVGHKKTRMASVDFLQNNYDLAQKIGAKLFTLHCGTCPFYQDDHTNRKLLFESILSLKIDAQLPCALENMPQKRGVATPYPNNLAELSYVISKLDNFVYTLDIGHAIQNGEDWKSWMLENYSKVYNIHLHDAIKNASGHLCLGKGELKIADLLEVLDNVEYDKYLTLEVLDENDINDSLRVLNKMLYKNVEKVKN